MGDVEERIDKRGKKMIWQVWCGLLLATSLVKDDSLMVGTKVKYIEIFLDQNKKKKFTRTKMKIC